VPAGCHFASFSLRIFRMSSVVKISGRGPPVPLDGHAVFRCADDRSRKLFGLYPVALR
jgi:hypothetical protein